MRDALGIPRAFSMNCAWQRRCVAQTTTGPCARMHTERQAGRPDATLGEPGAQSSSRGLECGRSGAGRGRGSPHGLDPNARGSKPNLWSGSGTRRPSSVFQRNVPGQIALPDADIVAAEIAPFASQRRCRCRQRRPGSGRSVNFLQRRRSLEKAGGQPRTRVSCSRRCTRDAIMASKITNDPRIDPRLKNNFRGDP